MSSMYVGGLKFFDYSSTQSRAWPYLVTLHKPAGEEKERIKEKGFLSFSLGNEDFEGKKNFTNRVTDTDTQILQDTKRDASADG